MAQYSHSPRATHSSCTACLHDSELGLDARVVVMGSSGASPCSFFFFFFSSVRGRPSCSLLVAHGERRAGVGKTTLIRRYTYAQNGFEFEEEPRGGPTTAPSFVTKKAHVGRTVVRLQLWDTPGQLRFRTMAPMYYRDADAALLLYDTTSPATFDSIRVWLEALKNTAPHILVYVVGITHPKLKAGTNAPPPPSSSSSPSSMGMAFNHTHLTPELARWLVSAWFPPASPAATPAAAAAPPPSPAARRVARFASYFRLPFRALSAPAAPPVDTPADAAQRARPRPRPRVSSACSPSPSPPMAMEMEMAMSVHSPPFSASAMLRQHGARCASLTQMRRTQSELLPHRAPAAQRTVDALAATSKSVYHSRSVSSLASLRYAAAAPGPDDEAASEAFSNININININSLPNKIEFVECALDDKCGIDGLFQHLLSSIADRAHTDAASSDVVSVSSRGSTPSPPSTPLSRSVLHPCYPPSEAEAEAEEKEKEKEKEIQNHDDDDDDDYYAPEAFPSWRPF
ncbi:hypothetical protein PC9H_002831 [Pleurotus ostreatus]|uniref:Uncharacterized protein n=1 Tax=Pleurotus ostreatus TaxID=5322 RepID=A0A8H7A4N6_PLEOS|nr:uncharacterized protein PC9H_002831 [Pleurotus ostreatus]KAF7436005.1 hypothetical protein PC9H_002831 [Pleurotus ostreatus]